MLAGAIAGEVPAEAELVVVFGIDVEESVEAMDEDAEEGNLQNGIGRDDLVSAVDVSDAAWCL